MGPYLVQPIRAWEDLEAMAMKGYSAFPKVSAFREPNHQMVLCHTQGTRWSGGSYPSAEMQSCILRTQLIGLSIQAQMCLTSLTTYMLTKAFSQIINLYYEINIAPKLPKKNLKQYQQKMHLADHQSTRSTEFSYYLHTVIWFPGFQQNTKNLNTIMFFVLAHGPWG